MPLQQTLVIGESSLVLNPRLQIYDYVSSLINLGSWMAAEEDLVSPYGGFWNTGNLDTFSLDLFEMYAGSKWLVTRNVIHNFVEKWDG